MRVPEILNVLGSAYSAAVLHFLSVFLTTFYSAINNLLEQGMMGQKSTNKSQQLSNRIVKLPFLFLGLVKTEQLHKLLNSETHAHTCSISSLTCQGGCIFENTSGWMVALATSRRCWHFCSDQPSSPERLHSWPTLSSLNTTAFISHTALTLSLLPPSLSAIQPSIYSLTPGLFPFSYSSCIFLPLLRHRFTTVHLKMLRNPVQLWKPCGSWFL